MAKRSGGIDPTSADFYCYVVGGFADMTRDDIQVIGWKMV